MDYESYMRSPEWQAKRDQAMERDGHFCQTCGSTDDLEVHHRRYPQHLGDEPLRDLITLCRPCHEAITSSIRARRYASHDVELPDTARLTPSSPPNNHLGPELELSDTARPTPLVEPSGKERTDVALKDTQRPTPLR